MRFKIQFVVEDHLGKPVTEGIVSLDKSFNEESFVGLSLAESKSVLKQLQKTIVLQQVNHYTETHRCCPSCHQQQRIKGHYNIQYRTLFGIVTIPNKRLYHCQCIRSEAKTFSVLNDWLSEHNSRVFTVH